MAFKHRSNSKLRNKLGPAGADFLEYAVAAIDRILPHAETTKWRVEATTPATSVKWLDADRRSLRIRIGLKVGSGYLVEGQIQRRRVPTTGVGSVARTLDLREQDICRTIASKLAGLVGPESGQGTESLTALRATFDERVVAAHLAAHLKVKLDLGRLFGTLRRLAENTYENQAQSLGCVIDVGDDSSSSAGPSFPDDFLDRKRYRALSDGYRTAYVVSGTGQLLRFEQLAQADSNRSQTHYPEWSRDLAFASRGNRLGLALTRQGDLLAFDGGSLRFTYRFGQWQYWNHSHLIDLLRNAARVQHVPTNIIPRVVAAVYRAALDTSFRRSGGLFVILRNQGNLHDLVRSGDGIDDPNRSAREKAFDRALPSRLLPQLPRSLVAELAALDGAIVLSNSGRILAYGAVLEPKRKGKIAAAEGSRTKAAIGASKYGIAIKISSDGDITVYVDGANFIHLGAGRGA